MYILQVIVPGFAACNSFLQFEHGLTLVRPITQYLVFQSSNNNDNKMLINTSNLNLDVSYLSSLYLLKLLFLSNKNNDNSKQ